MPDAARKPKDPPGVTAAYDEPWERQQGRPRPANYREFVKRYEGWVHHCAQINAQAVSCVPLRLYVLSKGQVTVPRRKVKFARRKHILESPYLARKAATASDSFEEVAEHPGLDVLDRPNPYMDGRSFFQFTELFLGLTGNSYTFIERGVLGQPERLWPLPSQWIKIIPGTSRLIDGYVLSRDEIHKQYFAPEDVIHLRRPNPKDPYYYGLGETEAETDTVWLSQAIDDYEISTFRNKCRPDMALKQSNPDDPPLTKDQRTEAVRELYRAYGGNRQGGVACLGGLEIVPIGWSPRDVSYLKGEEKALLRIANSFGVSKSMLTSDDVNKANALAGEQRYAVRTLLPRLRYYEEAFTAQWVSQFDERLFLAFDDPTPTDDEVEYKRDVAYVTSNPPIRHPDEVRADHGWEPMPEEYKQERLEQQQAMRPQLPGGNGSEEKPPKPPPKKAFKQAIPQPHAVGGEVIRQYEEALRALFAGQERQLLGEAKAVKAGEADEVLAGARYGEALTARLADMQTSWEHEFYGASRGHVELSMEIGAARGVADLRKLGATLETSFDVTNPDVVRFIDSYTGKLAKGITDTQDTLLRKALRGGLEAGDGIPKIRDRIREVFQSSKLRATNIARTETSRAVHGGQKEQWKQSRLVEKITWLTADDPCAYCSAMNGETISINDSFRELGDSIEAEGEKPMPVTWMSIGTPPAHPMCRCTMLPELVQV